MAKIRSLLEAIRSDYPAVTFERGEDFYWSPKTSTVFYPHTSSLQDKLTLLHETAHAVLGHRHFKRDIDLLKIERDAWDYVEYTLAPRYRLKPDPELVETMIDTYRDWLHARSRCPHCSLTGVQTGDSHYSCLGCDQEWRVNDARRCGLKRYALPT